MISFKKFHHFRKDPATRDKNSEVSLSPKDFIQPFFLVEGSEIYRKISSDCPLFHFSVDTALKEIEKLLHLGIDKILLFGVTEKEFKDEQATYATSPSNPVYLAIKAIKKNFPNITIMTDICICPYTSHGHCGIVEGQKILNDKTLPILAKMALFHAEAGADYVSPSAMMDGQVLAIRQELDKHKFSNVKIMSYSIKYASSFYGPFRDTINSSPSFGDRRTYQMDPRNASQALDEFRADVEEKADVFIVKPAHTYLDILYKIHQHSPKALLCAYQVSGEYMMLHASAQQGYLDLNQAVTEVFHAFKRSGAQWIITYDGSRYWSEK
ncbi:hypothetical protein AB834_04725 [PVC group bacterium (ex Bugula neritina AB1)]|nr:hypothetical protein AB834_04725 [PVC group bacterium (ex Bugula neritina AB1)]